MRRYSYITSLPEDVLAGLSSINELYLFLNLTGLPEDMFDRRGSLATLSLSSNQIRQLNSDVFNGLSSLSDLCLSNNQLSRLPGDVFEGLTSLESMVLSDNNTAELTEKLLDGLDDVDRLILTNNKLSELPAGILEGRGSLDTLYLGNPPGTPFTFTAELDRQGDDVVVELAEGAPFDLLVTVPAEGGTLSATTVTVDGGSIASEAIDVTPGGDGDVTVSVQAASFLKGTNTGIQTGRGDGLSLAAEASGEDGANSPVTGAPTSSGTA